jgi:uncharacterized membrane protein (DUF373 family)
MSESTKPFLTKAYLIEKIEFILAVVLFGAILITGYEFYKAIVLLLEFIVVMEVLKMISEFIKHERIKVRSVLDVFIIFLIRDVIIQSTHLHKPYEDILFLLFIIFIFFVFRILAIKYSPSRYGLKSVDESKV